MKSNEICQDCGNKFDRLVADNELTPNGKIRVWRCVECFAKANLDNLISRRNDND